MLLNADNSCYFRGFSIFHLINWIFHHYLLESTTFSGSIRPFNWSSYLYFDLSCCEALIIVSFSIYLKHFKKTDNFPLLGTVALKAVSK